MPMVYVQLQKLKIRFISHKDRPLCNARTPSLSTILKSGGILFLTVIDCKDRIQKIRQTADFSHPSETYDKGRFVLVIILS